MKLIYHGQEITKFYTVHDETFGEVRFKVVDKLDDEGKQRCPMRTTPTVDLSGSKLHQDFVKQFVKEEEDRNESHI